MEDLFLANGKILVVISVIVIIFIGIVLRLIYLEKKIKNLENKND